MVTILHAPLRAAASNVILSWLAAALALSIKPISMLLRALPGIRGGRPAQWRFYAHPIARRGPRGQPGQGHETTIESGT
jgi:hypothetical protein